MQSASSWLLKTVGTKHLTRVARCGIVICAVLVVSCDSRKSAEEELAAANKIHELVRIRDFSAIEDLVDPEYRKNFEAKPNEGFARLHSQCGEPGEATFIDRQRMQYGAHGELRVIVLTMETQYERGVVREQFFFREGTGNPGLVTFRYHGNCGQQ